MSMAETLSLLSTLSYILAGVFFILTVVLIVWFKAFSIIGELTGRTARKSIERMRKENEKNGGQQQRDSKQAQRETPVAETSVMVEVAEHHLGNDQHRDLSQMPETGLLDESRGISDTGHLQTGLLEMEETGLLENETAEIAPVDISRTRRKSVAQMTMIEDIVMIHSNEVIQ